MTISLLSPVCVALMAFYAIGFAAPGFDVYNDDGIYLVTAKALAEGSGYRIISLPEPIAQTKYPPAFLLRSPPSGKSSLDFRRTFTPSKQCLSDLPWLG